MPSYNQPANDWLGNRQARGLRDVETLKKQGTEYIVSQAQECVAIIGNIEHFPAPGSTKEEATGLTGWGIAVRAGAAWVQVGTPTVSSLPVSPADGQTIDYLVDPVEGVVWRFRYRAASGSPYKWEFIGGAGDNSAGAGAAITFASSGYVYQAFPAGAGPALTLPFAGDYEIGFGAEYVQQTAAGAPVQINMALALNGATFGPLVAMVSGGTFTLTTPWREVRIVNVAAGAVLTIMVAGNTTTASQWTVSAPTLMVRPVRVG